jgi:hypothetical protein
MVFIVIREPALRRDVAQRVRHRGFSAVPVDDLTHAHLLARGAEKDVTGVVADVPDSPDELRDLVASLRLWFPETPALLLMNAGASKSA